MLSTLFMHAYANQAANVAEPFLGRSRAQVSGPGEPGPRGYRDYPVSVDHPEHRGAVFTKGLY